MEEESKFEIKKLVIFILATIILLSIFFLYKETILSNTIKYNVTKVIDGDTIEVSNSSEKLTIRILGIDTPELHKPNTPVQCYAKEAQLFLEKLILNKDVEIQKDIEDVDIYGRKLRYVYYNSQNISTILLENGFAYLYSKAPNNLHTTSLRNSVKSAMMDQIGLWKDCIDKDARVKQAFGEYKIQFTSKSSESSQSGSSSFSDNYIENSSDCKIKGNVNSRKEKIYHLPGMINYDKIVMNENEGDLYLCTEEEAIQKGFRKSKQ